MGELKNEDDNNTLPAKRKSDLILPQPKHLDEDNTQSATKKPKSEAALETPNSPEPAQHQKLIEQDDDDEDEYEDEDEDEEEENSNGEEAEIDVKGKGKGKMKDDKGKGKLIEESEEENDDSSDDDDTGDINNNNSDDESDSDLSDDPLAEVDLDNILPSRTRRGVSRPAGVFIRNNFDQNDGNNDD